MVPRENTECRITIAVNVRINSSEPGNSKFIAACEPNLDVTCEAGFHALAYMTDDATQPSQLMLN